MSQGEIQIEYTDPAGKSFELVMHVIQAIQLQEKVYLLRKEAGPVEPPP